jgi:hypothetical protein
MTIRSKPTTDAYRDGWERTFGAKRLTFDSGGLERDAQTVLPAQRFADTYTSGELVATFTDLTMTKRPIKLWP